MSNTVIQARSGSSLTIMELDDPVLANLQARDLGSCQSCAPMSTLVTLTQFQEIPAECLPLPEGATIRCPELVVVCATGVPEPVAPGLVRVPVTETVLAHPVGIVSPSGAVVCTVEVASVTLPTAHSDVACPTTQRVSCTCSMTPITCEGCTFEFGGESLACSFRYREIIDCMACPPARGLGRTSTPL